MRLMMQRGFTFIELAIVLVITGILAVLALSSYRTFVDQQKLRSVAETMAGDFNWAKSQSRARNSNLYVSFKNTSGAWCYGFTVNGTCDCATANSCELKSVSQSDFPGSTVAITSSTLNASTLDAVRGLLNTGAASALITSPLNTTLQVNLSTLGVVSVCTPGSARMGYKACA